MNDRFDLPIESEIKKVLDFDKGDLPIFPQAAAKLLEASEDGTTSLKEFSRIMETDPGLSARILKIVNSALYGLGRNAATLSDAVVFLGLDEVRKQAITLSMHEKVMDHGGQSHLNRLLFWRHCLAVAVLSQKIAGSIGFVNPEEAYTAGLLHDLGILFLDLNGKTGYQEFIRSLSPAADIAIEEERRHFHLGHDDIGAYFCASWKMPDKLTAAVKYHHQPFAHVDLPDADKALVAIVALANFICWTQGIGSFDHMLPPILSPEVEQTIDLDRIDIIHCIVEMNGELERISAFYKFAFPSESRLKENLLWANLRLSRINTRYYYEDSPLMQVRKRTAKTDAALYLESEFSKPLAKAKSVKEVLDIVMYHIGRIFNPRHWSLLLKDPKTGNLVFSIVVGKNKEKLQGAKLPKGEGIAGYIAQTGESVIVEDVSKDQRFSKRVDRFTGFHTQTIVGAPLKTGDKIFGVIQLINKTIEDRFMQKDMELLVSIAEYAAIAIERSYYTQTLSNLATKDTVTGVKNRWSFERELGNPTEFKIQYGSVFSLLIITVGNLDKLLLDKAQNAYDEGIKKLAGMILKTKRRDDSLFRYGETVFLMLLPLTYSDGAQRIKSRLESETARAVSRQELPPLTLNITQHTLSSDEAGSFKALVNRSLVQSRQPEKDDFIADFEENIQPLVEKEKKQEAEENKKQKNFGKAVSLAGHFLNPETKKAVPITVRRISLNEIGFTIPKNRSLAVDDFLQVQFVLDDLKRSVIKRQIVVREVNGEHVAADFYNPPPFAKNLGFYLIN